MSETSRLLDNKALMINSGSGPEIVESENYFVLSAAVLVLLIVIVIERRNDNGPELRWDRVDSGSEMISDKRIAPDSRPRSLSGRNLILAKR